MPKVFEKDGHILVSMESGVEIRFPVAGNPRLSNGTPERLGNIEVSPFGLHRPDLDEDLSFRGLLEGDYGQRRFLPASERQRRGLLLDADLRGGA